MFLITCASGKTGLAIVEKLISQGVSVRAMVRTTESAKKLKKLGVAETLVGDLRNVVDVGKALENVSSLYYIAPNMVPEEKKIGKNIIENCLKAEVSHLVFHSVLHTQIEALPHHWERHFVEQSIINSGLPFTILQVGSYMQNMLPGWGKIVKNQIHEMPYRVDVPMSLVDLTDVAQVAFKILTEPGFENGIFEVAGPSITLKEKAEILTKLLGKKIIAEKTPLQQFLDHGKSLDFSEYALATMAKMFPYYDVHGLVGCEKTLEWILGVPPTNFETFARGVVNNYS